jgi:hypothetical protein
MFICAFESQSKRRTNGVTEWVLNSETKLCSIELFIHTKGCAVAHEVRPRPLTAEVRLHTWSVYVVSAAERVVVGQVFIRAFRFYTVCIVIPVPHAHSFTYHRCHMISAIDRVVK